MRRTIAGRLLEAKTTVPHFYLTADVEMDAAMDFREQVAQVHGAKLSVNDLVLKACALALRRIPEANASFSEEAIIQHARVDIGQEVPAGLVFDAAHGHAIALPGVAGCDLAVVVGHDDADYPGVGGDRARSLACFVEDDDHRGRPRRPA